MKNDLEIFFNQYKNMEIRLQLQIEQEEQRMTIGSIEDEGNEIYQNEIEQINGRPSKSINTPTYEKKIQRFQRKIAVEYH